RERATRFAADWSPCASADIRARSGCFGIRHKNLLAYIWPDFAVRSPKCADKCRVRSVAGDRSRKDKKRLLRNGPGARPARARVRIDRSKSAAEPCRAGRT